MRAMAGHKQEAEEPLTSSAPSTHGNAAGVKPEAGMGARWARRLATTFSSLGPDG